MYNIITDDFHIAKRRGREAVEDTFIYDIKDIEYKLPDDVDMRIIRHSRFKYKKTVKYRMSFACYLFILLGILFHSGALSELADDVRLHTAGSVFLTMAIFFAVGYFYYCFNIPLGISYGVIVQISNPADHGVIIRTDNNERVEVFLDDETASSVMDEARVIIIKQSANKFIVLPE